MAIKYRVRKIGETEMADSRIYDLLHDGEINENEFNYVCPNKECGCNMSLVRRNTPHRRIKYLMSPNHISGCEYAKRGDGIKKINFASESFVDSNSILKNISKKILKSVLKESVVKDAEKRDRVAGLAFGLEFTHTSKACKKIGDLVYQLLELNEDEYSGVAEPGIPLNRATLIPVVRARVSTIENHMKRVAICTDYR